jgi:rRNA processing protein Krr1/Pno1
MTGTEEMAARDLLRLVRRGVSYDEALKQITSVYNLDTANVAEISKAVADFL